MSVESAADRLAFLSVDDFGVTATYTPAAGGAGGSVIGIFDANHLEVDLSGGVPVSSNNPVFHCQTADLTGNGTAGDRFTINGVTYVARDFQADGTGMSLVELKKQ